MSESGGPMSLFKKFRIPIILVIVILVYLLTAIRWSEAGAPKRSRFHFKILPMNNLDRANWSSLNHLIIVPGHAIQTCTETESNLKKEDCWCLLEYQKGQVPLFLEHIKVAAQLAHKDKNSLLVLSGGETRGGMGPRSEGRSYFMAAEKMKLLKDDLYHRTMTENYARDSLENLLFSLCRFIQITGKLPDLVTVVGFPFKEKRFVELHREAAGIPRESFKYISVNLKEINQTGIKDDAYDDFKDDLFGCGAKLVNKRILRNPYNNFHGYKETCPQLKLSSCNKI